MSKFYTSILRYGSHILVREIENGKKSHYKIPCKPYLFVNSKSTNSKYKTLTGDPVERVDFDSPNDAKEFVQKYEGVAGFHIYGMNQWIYPFIYDNYPGTLDYDPSQISKVIIDIEVDSRNGFPNVALADSEVTAITLSKDGIRHVFGIKDFIPTDNKTKYYKSSTESELLLKFLEIWKLLDPDIISGWNTTFFDLPYLYHRITKVFGEKVANRLSPWGIVNERTIEYATGKFNQTVDIYGISSLDYLEIYKKFAAGMQPGAYRESFKLDDVAFHELKRKKIDYSEHGGKGTGRALADLYDKNFQKFIEYNIQDVDLVADLDDKMKFFELIMTVAYDAKINYIDAFTTVRLWDCIIHNHLMDQGIVVPHEIRGKKEYSIEGAYVKIPSPGLYKWVVSMDLNSLYPHLLMQYNMSPETLTKKLPQYANKVENGQMVISNSVERFLVGDLETFGIKDDLIKNNQTIVPTGCIFSRDHEGFIPKLMKKIYNERSIYKNNMISAQKKLEEVEYELNMGNDLKSMSKEGLLERRTNLIKIIARSSNLQMARKINLNGAYGALS